MDTALQYNTTTWTRLAEDARTFIRNPRQKKDWKECRAGCLIELQCLLELVSSRANTVIFQ